MASEKSKTRTGAPDEIARRAVVDWINGHAGEICAFLQELIRVPSVNPWFLDEPAHSQEKGVQDLIAAKLSPLGATIEQWEPDARALAKYEKRPGYYPDHRFEGRPDQAAVLPGTGGGRSLLLTGHVDVVKPGSGWTVEPFGGERRDGYVLGRGAVDMKGGLAAAVMAVEAVVRAGLKPRGKIIVGTVVDEEAGGMGTLAFVDHGVRADACIMVEPTDMKIAPLCRGILWGKLVLTGRSGHIELPQGDWRSGGAVDAIQHARLYLDHFDRINRDWALRKVHPYLALPCQILAAQLTAGDYPTSFADRAEITFNAQYLPQERDEFGLGSAVKKEIESSVLAVAATDPWLKDHPPLIEWMVDADCGETPVDHPFVQLLSGNVTQLGITTSVEGMGFHTDMGWFVNVGIPTVNFGPEIRDLRIRMTSGLPKGTSSRPRR